MTPGGYSELGAYYRLGSTPPDHHGPAGIPAGERSAIVTMTLKLGMRPDADAKLGMRPDAAVLVAV